MIRLDRGQNNHWPVSAHRCRALSPIHLQVADKVGSLEAGKYADLIAVGASPLDDINELLDVDFVMKGGKVYKNKD